MMEALFTSFFKNLLKHGLEYFGRYYGIYRGVCMDNKDPNKQGRILVRVPAVTGVDTHGVWAWPAAKWGGKDSGDFCVPDEKDPVWVFFENGDKTAPNYLGGWWPAPEGVNFAEGLDAYNAEGIPTKRIFKTKAGHELSFEDDPETLSCKLVWHDPEKDKYSFFAFTEDGSLQMANHKGCFLELRATDDDELVMIMDKNSNQFSMDKDGTKIVDGSGNVIELKEGAIQFIGKKDLIINVPGVNIKTGGVTIGDVATDSAVKGTSWLAWWTATVLPWLLAHTHPTGVGPSGPPIPPPLLPPQEKALLTDKLKMQ